jgi:MFS family permease
LPFLFFPWAGNYWFLLFASAMYQLFSRAAIPSLIEVLKRNMPKTKREHAFSLFFILSFVESGFLGLLFGSLLDAHVLNWKTLFFFAALMGLSSMLLFSRQKVPVLPTEAESSGTSLLQPWKESFQLVRERVDFAYFQGAFMIGGSALMLMAPALSTYYVDTLKLSYSNITTARFIFMAIGVAGSSLLWKKGLSRISLLKLTVWVLFGFGLFPLALLLAQVDTWFLYLAFFIYGIAQAGSHLIWSLSGTLFAPDQDNSSPYTRVNILMLGLRGAVMPLMGGLLCDLWGPKPILGIGTALCFYGMLYLFKRQARVPQL